MAIKYLTSDGLKYALEKIDKTKANIESSALTGEPTAPTPPATDNSNRIATTAFIKSVVPADVSDLGIKINKINNELFDRILDSVELTPLQSQNSAGINTNFTYGSGSYYINHTLKRYSVSAGDKIKITGTAQPAKENHYIWGTFVSSAFGTDKRRGPLCSKDSTLDVDETIVIEQNENYLFVTCSGDMKVIKVGEMVEGKLTHIDTTLTALESNADITKRSIRDHIGLNPRANQAAFESFKFLDRCKDVLCVPFAQKSKTHMVYCIPDLHKDYACLESHLSLFANSFTGTYEGQGGSYCLDGMCKVLVTAGDILFNGGNTVTSRESILAELTKFNEAIKPFVNYNAYVFPAIGGHDFNDFSSALADHDNKKIANNLTKRDQYDYLIAPSMALVRSAITLIKPSVPNVLINNVYAPCYYAVKDNVSDSYYIMLDECDHNATVVGTYEGAEVRWKMTKVNWTDNTFNAIDEETNTTYSNIPMGDFEYVYSRYAGNTYSNEQLNWVADLMKNAPSGTHFWLFNHSGLRGEMADYSGSRQAMRAIVNAYATKSTYTGNGNSTDGDLEWSVDVDFSDCDGIIVGVFRGHGHDCVEYDLGSFKEYMSDTPGNYSSTVKSKQIFADKFSGDLFVYKDSESKLYRLHHGRRRAGIDDVPTLEERLAILEASLS